MQLWLRAIRPAVGAPPRASLRLTLRLTLRLQNRNMPDCCWYRNSTCCAGSTGRLFPIVRTALDNYAEHKVDGAPRCVPPHGTHKGAQVSASQR